MEHVPAFIAGLVIGACVVWMMVTSARALLQTERPHLADREPPDDERYGA